MSVKADGRYSAVRSAPIGGAPPRVSLEKVMVEVVSPEGEVVLVSRQNANDLVRFNGYQLKGPPAPKAPAVAVEVAPVEPVSIPGEKFETGAEHNADALAEVMADLAALRQTAEELGIKVDSRWGKKRLNAEIDKARAFARKADAAEAVEADDDYFQDEVA